MLRIVPKKNAQGIVDYFDKELSRGDYYSEGQTIKGIWHGKGAWQLGLSGEVEREQFAAMANNVHPTKGGPLTERTVEGRRVAYDFNFNAPKSFPIVYQETRDERMMDAFRSSVRETMSEIEADMKCRVRVGGANHDRTVGNICYAEFIHHTSRPVDGFPDQLIHAHCIPFNAVWDAIEQKWKAGQFGDIKRDGPYYEAMFHAKLAAKLVDLGYVIERRGKFWELAVVPKSEIEKASRRTTEIEAEAKKRGIFDAERKSQLGAKTRKHKDQSMSMDELREKWSARIDPDVREMIHAAARSPLGRFGKGIERDAAKAVDFAADKLLERNAVITERKLLTEAMLRSLGAVTLDQLQRVMENDPKFVRKELHGEKCVTTQEVIAEEEAMIRFARHGRGTEQPLAPDHFIQDKRLNEQQRAAVMHVLQSKDRVTMIRGGAGTGKTTLMTEAIDAMNAGWRFPLNRPDSVIVLAPSADSSRDVLRKEGFANADTVAKFLQSTEMQAAAKGGVIWVDESGLLGSRAMAALFRVTEHLGARVVLSGDEGQHRSVERGDPLRLLREYAGVEPAHVVEIQRQRGLYKSAVAHLSGGDVAKGFDLLTKMGCVREVEEAEAHRRIAYDYATAIESKKSALIVSPTHAEGRRVTEAVRDELDRRGVLKGKSKTFDRLEDLRWTVAERGKADLYEKGMVIQFHQNVAGFKAGERHTVTTQIPGVGVLLNNLKIIPLDKAQNFNVYKFHEADTTIKQGDLIRITANGRSNKAQSRAFLTPKSHAVNNGASYEVKGFTASGDIRLKNGWVIDKDFGHFTHGYCSTSHSSQGKTVDVVFIAQSANSFGATSAEQFYVSVSRGRIECVIYTDDVEGLRRHLEQSQRPMAIEMSDNFKQHQMEQAAVKTAKRIAEEFARQRTNTRQKERDFAQEAAHGR
jgi:conjugative relaxase-like TrwC/TraI family protein